MKQIDLFDLTEREILDLIEPGDLLEIRDDIYDSPVTNRNIRFGWNEDMNIYKHCKLTVTEIHGYKIYLDNVSNNWNFSAKMFKYLYKFHRKDTNIETSKNELSIGMYL